MKELPWIAEARKLIGVTEAAGKTNNAKVVAMFKDAGCPEIKTDSTAWCAAFVGACLHRAKIERPATLWALNYSAWGKKLDSPAYGCVATKTRKNKLGKIIGGHVFFVVGWDRTFVYALGGNQNDSVNIGKYPRNVVVAYRWPSDYPMPGLQPANFNPGNMINRVDSES